MGLIPTPNMMKGAGAARLWNGIRTGAALYGIAWLRNNSGPKKELLYSKTIPEGSSFVIRTGKPGELPRIDVTKLSD